MMLRITSLFMTHWIAFLFGIAFTHFYFAGFLR